MHAESVNELGLGTPSSFAASSEVAAVCLPGSARARLIPLAASASTSGGGGGGGCDASSSTCALIQVRVCGGIVDWWALFPNLMSRMSAAASAGRAAAAGLGAVAFGAVEAFVEPESDADHWGEGDSTRCSRGALRLGSHVFALVPITTILAGPGTELRSAGAAGPGSMSTVVKAPLHLCFPVEYTTDAQPLAQAPPRHSPPPSLSPPLVTFQDATAICAGLFHVAFFLELFRDKLVCTPGEHVLLAVGAVAATGGRPSGQAARAAASGANGVPIALQLLLRVLSCRVTVLVDDDAHKTALRQQLGDDLDDHDVVVIPAREATHGRIDGLTQQRAGGIGFDVAVALIGASQSAAGAAGAAATAAGLGEPPGGAIPALCAHCVRVGGRMLVVGADGAAALGSRDAALDLLNVVGAKGVALSFASAASFHGASGECFLRAGSLTRLLATSIQLLLLNSTRYSHRPRQEPAREVPASSSRSSSLSESDIECDDTPGAAGWARGGDRVVDVPISYTGRVIKSGGLLSAFTEAAQLPESSVWHGLPIVVVDE